MKQILDNITDNTTSAPFQVGELFRPTSPQRDFAIVTEWAVLVDVNGNESAWTVAIDASPTPEGPFKPIDVAAHLDPARIRLGGSTWFRLRATRRTDDAGTLSAWAG